MSNFCQEYGSLITQLEVLDNETREILNENIRTTQGATELQSLLNRARQKKNGIDKEIITLLEPTSITKYGRLEIKTIELLGLEIIANRQGIRIDFGPHDCSRALKINMLTI